MHPRHPLLREAVLSAAAAAGIAAVLAWLGPPGTDLAAHAYQRTLFLEHGFVLWNNFWYAGRYSFVTYSLLYYPLAALLGIRLLAVATIALAALAFAVVLWRQWGATTRWSSRSFAVVWAGIVLSAAFPFALGIALALLAIWALQARARWRFAALAALTLAASPLAFLLLVVVVAGVALSQRASLRRDWVPFLGIGLAGLFELVLWRLFPSGGRFPFPLSEAASGVLFCVLGLVFTWRVESARVLRFVFAVYLAACVAAYLVPSDVGGNIERMRFAAIPLAVLVFSLRRWRPLALGIAVVALAVAWNVSPLASSYVNGQADVTAAPTAWPAAIGWVHAHLGPRIGSRPSTRAGTGRPSTSLTRASRSPAAGSGRTTSRRTRCSTANSARRRTSRWLRGLGVKYVVLSDAPPDYSARAEAALVSGGRAGLVPVFATQTLTIFAVPHPTPILTGPGTPRLESLTEARMDLVVTQEGRYRIAVRWSPYWQTSAGCLGKGKDGMIRLTTRQAEVVRLDFQVNAERALDELTGISPTCKAP